jgi:PTH1 family peptidyl-tRNA hydrolase
MTIRLIVGLGNPGRAHHADRHNAGFWLLERLARLRGLSLRQESRFHGLAVRDDAAGVWLLMPETYMNLSGKAVSALAGFFKIIPEHVLVVHDELDFVPGVVKLKLGGGSGGHNGLKDISAQLGTQEYWRLRLGIGHPGSRDLVHGYVLGTPRAEEREAIDAAIDRALAVMPQIMTGDLQGAMHQLHTPSATQAVTPNKTATP